MCNQKELLWSAYLEIITMLFLMRLSSTISVMNLFYHILIKVFELLKVFVYCVFMHFLIIILN